ncbi:MAG TPA: DinB family protein [Gemmatimonadaceae bacterium]|nr:DinB family protein [Gemmatimonadaceae bacterium]
MTQPTSTPSSARAPESSSPAKLLYSDLEIELDVTRRFLERYPDGKGDWMPHEKSMKLGRLATHVADIPRYGKMLLETDEMDFATNRPPLTPVDSAQELLAIFDARAAETRATLAATDYASLERPWTMRNGEQVILSAPKGALVRRMMINHLVHHRAQLGVYYRLLGVPVPGSYGPSADEPI